MYQYRRLTSYRGRATISVVRGLQSSGYFAGLQASVGLWEDGCSAGSSLAGSKRPSF